MNRVTLDEESLRSRLQGGTASIAGEHPPEEVIAFYLAVGAYGKATDELRILLNRHNLDPVIEPGEGATRIAVTAHDGDRSLEISGTSALQRFKNVRVTVNVPGLSLTFTHASVPTVNVANALINADVILGKISAIAEEGFTPVSVTGEKAHLVKVVEAPGIDPITVTATVESPLVKDARATFSVAVVAPDGWTRASEVTYLDAGESDYVHTAVRKLLVKRALSEVKFKGGPVVAEAFAQALRYVDELVEWNLSLEDLIRYLTGGRRDRFPNLTVDAKKGTIEVGGFDIRRYLEFVVQTIGGPKVLEHVMRRLLSSAVYTDEGIENARDLILSFGTLPVPLATTAIAQGMTIDLSPEDAYKILCVLGPKLRETDDYYYLSQLNTVCEHNSRWCTELVLKDPELSGGVEWKWWSDGYFVEGYKVEVKGFAPNGFLVVEVNGTEVKAKTVKAAVARWQAENGIHA